MTPRQDGPALHFLKGLPDRYLLMIALMLMAGMYAVFTVDALLQVVINLVIAIIALSQKKPEPQVPTEQIIKADTIEADSVNTETMDSASITTGTVKMEKK